ncbi:MAG: c-type cytochrome [Ignavibacteriae bacterium]|nr:c-type cytochrome [Ignavibacteriota bacterium]
MAQKYDDKVMNHDADGIQEFDNNLPRWWLYGFYFTIVFAFVYMILFHVTGSSPLSKQEYDEEIRLAEASSKGKPVKTVAAVALTDAVSLKSGKEIFDGNNNLCYTCHKADGGGLVGPNLTDDYWIHGCDLKAIMSNITSGFPDKGMLPFGSGAKLTDEQLLQVASYVISLHDTHPPDAKEIDPAREIKCEDDKEHHDKD